jgi:hypothetical protein
MGWPRKTRKRSGGSGSEKEAFKGLTVIRMTDNAGSEVPPITRETPRLSDITRKFTTSDGKTYTVTFKPALENEGQFNLGVGSVTEDPKLFARIQEVDAMEMNDNTIYAGFLLHRMAPDWFVDYKGVYRIGAPGSPLHLEIMEKVDTTLFYYIVEFVKNYLINKIPEMTLESLTEDDIKKMLAELCPFIYRLYFQKMVIEEIKYKTFGERYIDFKADNIGLMLGADGKPTQMKLFDQRLGKTSFLPKSHAIIYEWTTNAMKTVTSNNETQFSLISFRSDVKQENAKKLYRSLLQANCENEQSIHQVIRSLLLGDDRLKTIYNVCIHLKLWDNMLVFPEAQYKENVDIKEINGEMYYMDTLVDSTELMKRQQALKGENESKNIFNLQSIETRAGYLLQNQNSLMLLKMLITSLNVNRKQKLKLCVYLTDSDFEAFVASLNGEYSRWINPEDYNYYKKNRSYYEGYDWFVEEFVRLSVEQIVGLMRIWRTLVRTHFILGPIEDTKIWLMEAKEETFRFPALFKALCLRANVQGMEGILSELKERVLPTEVPVLSLEAFKDKLIAV